MSVATITSAHIVGLDAEPVNVEVDVGHGLYSFSIVGLPDKAVDESKDRVIAALKNSYAKNPKTENHKVVVSLSPAHIKKEGTHFDVPIALSYLAASRQITIPRDVGWFIGELSLSGDIHPVSGVLPIAKKAKELGVTSLYIPYDNKDEAAFIEGLQVYPCKNLSEIINHFKEDTDTHAKLRVYVAEKTTEKNNTPFIDFASIKGQETAKRALLIAATGGHNVALYGPPGTGKSMLAKAFVEILPPLSKEEALTVTSIYSVTKKNTHIITTPPFRNPHHTASYVAIIGGGSTPRPGEVTFAHKGVLFLDEFPEFDKKVLESLREPLEEGVVSIARSKGTLVFPASVTLIAAMNPCPCGYYNSKVKRCVCSQGDIDRYAKKVSGPIMDRIDIWVPVLHIEYDLLLEKQQGESTYSLKQKVEKGRNYGRKRQEKSGKKSSKYNKDLTTEEIEKDIILSKEVQDIMRLLSKEYTLSPRSCHRILRLARTIADLEERESIIKEDILEAFQYRPKLYRE